MTLPRTACRLQSRAELFGQAAHEAPAEPGQHGGIAIRPHPDSIVRNLEAKNHGGRPREDKRDFSLQGSGKRVRYSYVSNIDDTS